MARAFVAVLLAITLCLGIVSETFGAVPALNQPAWTELSPDQRTILSPLANDWVGMENFHRKKWLGIATRYPAMSLDEQARVQRRMREWATLSPEQRRLARENYKSLKQITPEHKEVLRKKWEEYSQLPETEKAQLKADGLRKTIPRTTAASNAPTRPLEQVRRPLSPLLAPMPPNPVPPAVSPDSAIPPATATQP